MLYLTTTLVIRMPHPQPLNTPDTAERSVGHQTLPDGAYERAELQSGFSGVEDRTFTLAEVAKHDCPDSAWIAVNGKVPICHQQASHCQSAYIPLC